MNKKEYDMYNIDTIGAMGLQLPNLENIALELFDEWLENVEKVYGFSHQFSEMPVRYIVESFGRKLVMAIKCLAKRIEKKGEAINLSWAYGFICGFLEPTITGEWVYKFIIEPTMYRKQPLKYHTLTRSMKSCDLNLLVLKEQIDNIDNCYPKVINILSMKDVEAILALLFVSIT